MYILIVLVLILVCAFTFRYFTGTCKAYNDNVEEGFERIENNKGRIITENDLEDLPQAVQDYLRYVGVIGKEMPTHFRVKIDGEMRFDKTSNWADISASQVSFLENETRLFYMVMRKLGISINGLHHYEKGAASMVIKILDIFKVVDSKGNKMDIAETVTYFNDMCIFAPAALIDADIVWEEIDDNTVNAIYTSNDITISAELFFNEKGELINFISDDRYFFKSNGEHELVRWSTPLYEYAEFNGYNLVSKGEAVWNYEDGDFSYIRLNIIDHSYD